MMDYEISRFSRSLLTFAATMTIIIMIVGIFGNLLTIVALLKCPKVRNVAAAFIISLCVADFLFCAIVLPFSAFRFIHGTWTHGDLLCQLIPFIQYGNIGVSLLCIAMITINRYIMIAHHNAYSKIYKRHWIGMMIVFCWLFAYGMQLPTLFRVWGVFDFDPKLGTCSIMNDVNGNSSKTALFVIAFIIPCLIIIACYTKIFWVVHQSEARLRKHAHKQNSIPNNLRKMPSATSTIPSTEPNRVSSPISSSSLNESCGMDSKNGTSQKTICVKDQRDIKARRNEWRITKMVLAIFLSFVVCYLPITIAKVADKDVDFPGFHVFGYIMLYLSSCINPIIYVIMNKQYRQAYKTVLMCEPSRLLPFTKAIVGSSFGEKWKDIGYSCNHSRTMVSQVSNADQQNSSFSSSQQQPVMVELSIKPQPFNSSGSIQHRQLPDPTNTNENIDSTFPTMKITIDSNSQITSAAPAMISANPMNNGTINNNNNHHVTNQNSYNNVMSQQLHHTGSVFLEQPPLFIKRRDTQRTATRITLANGDIIVEEEEVPPEPMVATHPSINVTTAAPIDVKEHYKQEYGQNINATPDSDKVVTKSKILPD